MVSALNRRRVLRGMLNGGAVTVALPLLDCFLNGNGTALASGEALPQRFGTWFWGLGMSKAAFVPKTLGPGFDFPVELEPLAPVKQHINVLTGFDVLTDGKPNFCHGTGWIGLRCGAAPATRTDLPGQSLDVTVSERIGGTTRFRSLDAAATGNPRDAYSFNGPNAYNPPIASAVDLYRTVFGPDFQNPNLPTFTPSPSIMARKSVLSAVVDQRAVLNRELGAGDRARLDEYFSNVRQVENQLALQLEKPAPMPNCKQPASVDKEFPAGIEADLVASRHKTMTDILVMALACNQTKVVNMVYSNSGSNITRVGYEKSHHTITHEEVPDDALGYQPTASWFVRRAMESWSYFVAALANAKEGEGTLLDNTLIYAHSDQSYAKIHAMDGIPMFTAGRAGGKLKTGIHVAGGGQPGTRLGFTVQRLMGVEMTSWGVGANKATQEIGEILV